jgi:hypothetical protein
MPLYATAILFNTNNYLAFAITSQVQKIIYLVVFATTYLLPSLTAMLLLQTGKINSIQMEQSRERNIPFLVTAIYFAACFYLLQKIPMARILGYAILGASIAIFISFLVNLRWKISIHMVGIGGIIGLLYVFSQQMHFNFLCPILFFAIVAGALGTSRLIMNAHVPSQIYAGFLLGFAVEWIFLRSLQFFG